MIRHENATSVVLTLSTVTGRTIVVGNIVYLPAGCRDVTKHRLKLVAMAEDLYPFIEVKVTRIVISRKDNTGERVSRGHVTPHITEEGKLVTRPMEMEEPTSNTFQPSEPLNARNTAIAKTSTAANDDVPPVDHEQRQSSSNLAPAAQQP